MLLQYVKMKRDQTQLRKRIFEIVNFVNMVSRFFSLFALTWRFQKHCQLVMLSGVIQSLYVWLVKFQTHSFLCCNICVCSIRPKRLPVNLHHIMFNITSVDVTLLMVSSWCCLQAYKPLKTFIALVGLEIWSNRDLISVTPPAGANLDAFMKWRNSELVKRKKHDNAHLIRYE